MTIELATFLSMLGVVNVGNGGPKWSIGGPVASIPPLMPHSMQPPKGLSYSHNFYEGDGSPTRSDVYRVGQSYKLDLYLFQELVDLADDPYTHNYNDLD